MTKKITVGSSKKIAITGGCGFLGSHLCEQLLNNGNEVYMKVLTNDCNHRLSKSENRL